MPAHGKCLKNASAPRPTQVLAQHVERQIQLLHQKIARHLATRLPALLHDVDRMIHRLGIARALQEAHPEMRVPLKRAGLLTRDPRAKERKKYGLRGARARFQFSKR